MIFCIHFALFLCLSFQQPCSSQEPEFDAPQMAFIILSQSVEYHNSLAEELKSNILNQATSLSVFNKIKIYLSHKDFGDQIGYWTLMPLFQRISKLKFDWVCFLEDHTVVDLQKVLKITSTFNSTNDIFAGYALQDSNPTIIHHFDATDDEKITLYPHFSAGFFISSPLIAKLTGNCKDCHFSIDPKYELAKFIWKSAGVRLIHVPFLCLQNKEECATWIRNDNSCKFKTASNEIHVAVKTCQKFHTDRVNVLKGTWAPDVDNLLLFSDVSDPSVPSVSLDVENVESGHCEKTLSIMRYLVDHSPRAEWVVIVDDDTLLSYSRLKALLKCFDPAKDLALGERYGYGVTSKHGYNFLTGGSGMVFSMPSVRKLVSACQCPSIDSPDDMIIGVCLKNLDIPVTHSPLFHQARPIDYSPDFLKPWKHISFHKHWMIDPFSVYRDWLLENLTFTTTHSEL